MDPHIDHDWRVCVCVLVGRIPEAARRLLGTHAPMHPSRDLCTASSLQGIRRNRQPCIMVDFLVVVNDRKPYSMRFACCLESDRRYDIHRHAG